jgi:hypothetical protein
MCFLRPAQGFGWLDLRPHCSATTLCRSHHNPRIKAIVCLQRRLAAEVWDAKGLAIPT